MSGENHEGNKSLDIYDGNEQRRSLCSWAEREGHQNVQGQIRLSLGATLERGEGDECPLVDRAVVVSNVQKREGH
jgi:hypothetical protein